MADPLYTVEALSTGGGRDGHVATADKAVDLEMAPPTELGGSGEGNNPEQLFAAGYAACFHSALQSAARMKKVAIDGSSVGARVSLVRSGEESIDLAVDLEVVIPGLESEKADELAQLAHELCPYSRATKGNIEVSVSVSDD
ncbi:MULTISPECIES: organic hydroperoxide resistance protein [unclassified Dietzia]|uniref:organic hydroperoxide resistance protein n=1 Tax=unclassified Dietzia TaxID=2617939 RepID=UPI0015FB3786|nr:MULTISPECIES: organic hydroperoxide resistance protein [unclassified Dietzia]MBB1023690.1 organic hydroperoxide resistance protein [Dietzia sp. DQ12-76]MBB1027250.1 organic hydroperoxide resistance protein [Dietzia sp. DQ11-38-2]